MKSKRQSKITPSRKVVLIEMVEVKSSSDIDYVTEKKQEIGKIVAIGDGKQPIQMKVGDTIAFRKFGEDKLFIEGKDRLKITRPTVVSMISFVHSVTPACTTS